MMVIKMSDSPLHPVPWRPLPTPGPPTPDPPVSVAESLEEWLEGVESRGQRSETLHRMPYDEYLQTPEWRRLRTWIIRRAQFKCELCGDETQLNVHHWTYERRGFERPEDLIALCRHCHMALHGLLEED